VELINIIADIQANPKNLNAYRRAIVFFQEHNMMHEAESFQLLLESIKNESSHNSNSHLE
jgi:hypothetical protein